MKKLIIAEKPSVARDIARILGAKRQRDGYIEGERYIVSWCVGHLVNIAEPKEQNPGWEKWRLDALPMIPNGRFKLTVLSNTKKQFNVIKKLMNSKDVTEIICATDAGREGELIFRRVYSVAGCEKPVKRLWISSLTDEAIREGFKNLKPEEEYRPLALSAYARAEADWLVGMNFSRLFTIKCNDLLSIGRVQTPVLAMLVQRRLEIENFKPTPYWQIEAKFVGFSALWFSKKDGDKIWDKEKALNIYEKCDGKKAIVIKVQKKKGTSQPPLLFDLTTLQREANNKYNFTAQQTLSIAQSLYEKHKLITYPRTDSQYISKDVFAQINRPLMAIQGLYSALVDQVKINLSNKKTFKCVNDKKVTDHHAIIPTEKKPDINQLNDREKKIYDLICRRFLASFLPPAEYYSTTAILGIEKETFKATGKVFINKGWLEAEPWKLKEDTPLPPLKKGQILTPEEIKLLEKQTKPPAHYTDSTLLKAMETAGRQVEDEELAEAMKERGLGTPATRAAIVERLIQVGYTKREKKKIIATDKGVQLIQAIKNILPPLTSPTMTGEWEYKLKLIEKKQNTYQKFMQEIIAFVSKEINRLKNQTINYQGKQQGNNNGKILGKCPLCGGQIIEGKKGFGCANWKTKGCKFVIWKQIAGKKITKNLVKTLLERGETEKINGFKSKNGKKFDAKLKINQNGKIEFVFG